MADGIDSPELFPLFFFPRIHGIGACIGEFDLKCDACESCAARPANEVRIGFVNVHP